MLAGGETGFDGRPRTRLVPGFARGAAVGGVISTAALSEGARAASMGAPPGTRWSDPTIESSDADGVAIGARPEPLEIGDGTGRRASRANQPTTATKRTAESTS